MDRYDKNTVHDSSTGQDSGQPNASYPLYSPQHASHPPHQDRFHRHHSSSDASIHHGEQPRPSYVPASFAGESYHSTSSQPGPGSDLRSYAFSQSPPYRQYPPYPSHNEPQDVFYEQSNPMAGVNQNGTYHAISQQSPHRSEMNVPANQDYQPSDIVESRRPTITPQTYRRDMARLNSDLHSPSNPNPLYPSHETSTDPMRYEQRYDHPQAARENRAGYAPYHPRRNTIKASTYAAAGPFQQPPGRTSSGSPSEYGTQSLVGGAIAIPQLPSVNSRVDNANLHRSLSPPDSRRHDQGQHTGYVGRDQISQSLPSQSSAYWPDYSMSTVGTPAYTEGSADPAQSDQEEFDAHTSTSPTNSASTSTSASSAASRWARFRVPADIFNNPPDPPRHELYHRIRREAWFVQQLPERHLHPHEAERIPGSMSGESVLLAFYDRILDNTGKTAMRCAICAQTNPDAQLYPRPDRAKVHMRHHFELRPIPCNGNCKSPQCTQRFFTHSDLTAHVTGKTEPLATCPKCDKTMRQKNIKRHMTQYCQSLNRR